MVNIPCFQCRAHRFNLWLGELRCHMPRGIAKKLKNKDTILIKKKKDELETALKLPTANRGVSRA